MNNKIHELAIPENFKEWCLLELFVKACNGYLALVDFKGNGKFLICYNFDWYYFACQWFECMGYEKK